MALGWKRLDHVSIATEDPKAAAAFWGKLLGGELDHFTVSPEQGFRVSMLHLPKRQTGIELIGPYDESSFVQRFLSERGPGVHHLTIEVEDIEQALAHVREEMGIEPLAEPFEDYEWKQFFVHPRDAGGVLLQFYEWLPGRRPADWPE